MCWLLLKHKANPNIPNEALGQTPLHIAVSSSNKRVVQILLTYDASSVVRDRAGRRALDLVKSPEIERLLTEPQQESENLSGTYGLSSTPEPRESEQSVRDPEPDPSLSAPVLEPSLSTTDPTLPEPSFPPIPDIKDTFSLTFKPHNDQEVIVTVSNSLQPSPREEEEVVFERDVTLSPPGFNPTFKPQEEDKDHLQEPESEINDRISNPMRTFSFGSDYKKSTLYMWLSNAKLDFLFESLVDQGFDDVEAMLSTPGAITLDTLDKVGIKKYGHKVRLMACLEEEAADRRRASAPVAENKPKSKSISPFQICSAPQFTTPNYTALPTLVQWLEGLKLKHLHQNFVTAGYEDLEHVLGLMHTKYALTDEVLEHQLNISKLGYRHRLLLKLQDDAPRVTSMRNSATLAMPEDPDPMFEKESKTIACEMCSVM